ncbi:MAG TPA: ATP-binding cassette domain-containing protein, partial [Nocardioides sp.]
EVSSRELAALMMGSTASDAATDSAVAAAVGLAPAVATPEVATTTAPDSATPALRVDEVTHEVRGYPVLDRVSLQVAPGEIVGVAGVSGNGQTELTGVLAGTLAADAGRVEVAGRDVTHRSVAERLAAGLGRLTEDRRGSVIPQLSVEQNLVLEDLPSFTRRGVLDNAAIRRHAEELIERFDIRARPTDAIATLSGGNMQKVLLARTLWREPRALVAAQPTRGLDVGAYRYVHDQLEALKSHGGGVLVISEDLDELRTVCDRILVLFRGRIIDEVAAGEASNDRLGRMMAGVEVPA